MKGPVLSTVTRTSSYRRRASGLIGCVIAIPLAVYAYSSQLTTIYEARATVEARIELASPSEATGPLELEPRWIAYYASQEEVVQRAASILGRPPTAVAPVGVIVDGDTGWVTLAASDASSAVAVTTANAFARALDEEIGSVTSEIRRRAIAETRADLRLDPDPEERIRIAADLRMLRQFPGRQGVRVVEPAAGARVTAPNPGRNAGLAAALALLLAPALMLAAQRLDRRVRRVADLERLAGAEMLADARDGADEAFRMLRDRLLHGVHGSPLVVAVVSPFAAGASAAVAIGLADAFADAGSDVVLVDADTREGRVADALGLPGRPGIVDVLGGLDPVVALQDVARRVGRLRVLPAGAGSPDAERLLRSQGLGEVIGGLAQRCDVVVFGTSPVLVSSEALPLLRHASGALAVFEIGRTQRDAVRRTSEIVAKAGGRLAGVVNASKSIPPPAGPRVRLRPWTR